MIPKDEINLISQISEYIYTKNYIELSKIQTMPSIIETMHNGARDSIDVVDSSAMVKMLNFLNDLVDNIEVSYDITENAGGFM